MLGLLLLCYEKSEITASLVLGSGISGIFCGVVIFIAGGLGIALYKDHRNINKAGCYLAFSIASCCLSVVGIINYAGAMDSFDKYMQFV